MLPTAFQERTIATLGKSEADALFDALEGDAPTSIRLNPARGYEAAGESVPWCEKGRYLPQRPKFTLDPLFHAGCYYVQEAASMFLAHAINALPTPPQCVLDLCAAPGGKSTLWRSKLANNALLVANDPVRSRAMILAENMAKWGDANVVVTQALPKDFGKLSGTFDVISADVPCSGEGMFRKDKQAREEWSEANVKMCAQRQREIIADAWDALKEGGHLMYSTCTFNSEENEENVAWIAETLDAEVLDLQAPAAWRIVESPIKSGKGYHFYPHRTQGEGFFLAMLRKTSACPATKGKVRKASLPNPTKQALCEWLQLPEDWAYFSLLPDTISAVRKNVEKTVAQVLAIAKTVQAGVSIAEIKGKKFIPQAPLALSTSLATDAFPRIALSESDALAFLRRDALVLSDAPRGYVLLTYQGHALGFANNLGTRANNLYPAEWRIRSQQNVATVSTI